MEESQVKAARKRRAEWAFSAAVGPAPVIDKLKMVPAVPDRKSPTFARQWRCLPSYNTRQQAPDG